MTAAARLPDNAPFPADAIAVLNRVIAGTTAVQRGWLSGFLAGIEAANPVAAAAAPPAAKQPLTILFATESGNAEALAAKAKKDAARLGFAARVLDAAEATPSDLAGAKNLVAIVSTWGEGEPPQRATIRFYSPEDHAAARRLGRELGQLGYPWQIENLTARSWSYGQKTLEVWLPDR